MSSRSTACAAIGRSALVESGGRPNPASGPGGEGIALYLHIPFCLSKCPYCDFNTYEGIETLMGGYIAALAREIELWGGLLKQPRVTSIYFGGGTPSYIPPGSIDSTMAAVHEAFDVLPDAEISMEANPGDITPERVESWRSTGINRMSIGVQSFDDGLLVSLGRRHSSEQAAEAARIAKSHGFQNFSLDLMFGLPNQTLDHWRDSVERSIELGPRHLSLYGLSLEPGTPLEADVRLGRTPLPDSDLGADMYTLAEDRLAAEGFDHYEISNWAKPGFESTHNLAYWNLTPYLGLGPGAHSFVQGRRFSNIRSPRGYIRCLEALDAPEETGGHPAETMRALGVVEEIEPTDRGTAMADAMMMGMRLAQGVSHARFEQRFGVKLTDAFGDAIREMSNAGLIVHDQAGIRLTRRGRLLGNEVFGRFVEDSPRAAEVRPTLVR